MRIRPARRCSQPSLLGKALGGRLGRTKFVEMETEGVLFCLDSSTRRLAEEAIIFKEEEDMSSSSQMSEKRSS